MFLAQHKLITQGGNEQPCYARGLHCCTQGHPIADPRIEPYISHETPLPQVSEAPKGCTVIHSSCPRRAPPPHLIIIRAIIASLQHHKKQGSKIGMWAADWARQQVDK